LSISNDIRNLLDIQDANIIFEENCYISEHTNAQVVIKSTDAQPLISIARDCSVSPTTVQRVITK